MRFAHFHRSCNDQESVLVTLGPLMNLRAPQESVAALTVTALHISLGRCLGTEEGGQQITKRNTKRGLQNVMCKGFIQIYLGQLLDVKKQATHGQP